MLNLPAIWQTSPTDPEPSSMAGPESLAQAFEWLTPSATDSPESYYALLQAEMVRLGEELAIKKRDLACSLAAERLLALGGELAAQSGAAVPEALRSLLGEIIAEKSETERIWRREGPEGCRCIGVTCTSLAENHDLREVFVFILRDVTEQRRLEEKQEFARRVQALAEMTALLAHEIRNPLGSLELFVGLIKQATLDQPEVAAWVVHVQ